MPADGHAAAWVSLIGNRLPDLNPEASFDQLVGGGEPRDAGAEDSHAIA